MSYAGYPGAVAGGYPQSGYPSQGYLPGAYAQPGYPAPVFPGGGYGTGKPYALVRSHGCAPPDCAPFGQQTDGPRTCLAIGHTPDGDIPGKAEGKTCWCPYGGRELLTENFSWIVCTPGALQLQANNGSGPPPNAVMEGHQHDQPGVPLYSAVANSQWGTIPGKATGDTCWFGYGDEEHTTSNFSWVIYLPNYPPYVPSGGPGFTPTGVIGKPYAVVRSRGCAPPDCAPFGQQTDGPRTCLAIGHTPDGDIPGKAEGKTCWCPYGGRELLTENFSWIVCTPGALQLQANSGSGPPPNAVMEGRQLDQPGVPLYSAVANSQWGTIPGKATGDTCWFGYGDEEHTTNNFSWVIYLTNYPPYQGQRY